MFHLSPSLYFSPCSFSSPSFLSLSMSLSSRVAKSWIVAGTVVHVTAVVRILSGGLFNEKGPRDTQVIKMVQRNIQRRHLEKVLPERGPGKSCVSTLPHDSARTGLVCWRSLIWEHMVGNTTRGPIPLQCATII